MGSAVDVDAPRVLLASLFDGLVRHLLLEVGTLGLDILLLASRFLRGPPRMIGRISLRVLAEHETILGDVHQLVGADPRDDLLAARLPLHLELLELFLKLERLLLLVRREAVVAVAGVARVLRLAILRYELLLLLLVHRGPGLVSLTHDSLVLALEEDVLVRIRIFPREESGLGAVAFHSFFDHSLLWSRALALSEVHDAFVPGLSQLGLSLGLSIGVIVRLTSQSLFELHLLVHFLLLVRQNRMLTEPHGSKLPLPILLDLLVHTILLSMLARSTLDRIYVRSRVIGSGSTVVRVLDDGLLLLRNGTSTDAAGVHWRVVLGLVMRVRHALVLMQVNGSRHVSPTFLLVGVLVIAARATYTAQNIINLL
uniref:Uncharacterized protein n=1 Tax=Strombidium inclinatum TaxID=197538 RepID=A0A7S3IT07_9SPIT|mmetsp:Transcript_38147/g.58167  ORF Transcript_38147/g.58167 Transcript_38147/m.58167 type:complete len:369 (+) Transcript_38147:610-1716(+)